MMTLDMVAGLTGLNYETVKRHCQKGVIKAVKIGREWRVKKDDFQKIGEEPQI
jgi:excisionase family DNA binding protein